MSKGNETLVFVNAEDVLTSAEAVRAAKCHSMGGIAKQKPTDVRRAILAKEEIFAVTYVPVVVYALEKGKPEKVVFLTSQNWDKTRQELRDNDKDAAIYLVERQQVKR